MSQRLCPLQEAGAVHPGGCMAARAGDGAAMPATAAGPSGPLTCPRATPRAALASHQRP